MVLRYLKKKKIPEVFINSCGLRNVATVPCYITYIKSLLCCSSFSGFPLHPAIQDCTPSVPTQCLQF